MQNPFTTTFSKTPEYTYNTHRKNRKKFNENFKLIIEIQSSRQYNKITGTSRGIPGKQ